MSTSKHIDKICAAAGYESRLFDTSMVHTINIVMDDWDTFLEGCLCVTT